MSTKKVIILIVLFLAFCQAVKMVNDRASSELFNDFYTGEFENPDKETVWDKIGHFFESFFKKKEERYIYK